MKLGLRIPSIQKRIAARTSLKRVVRHSLGLKAPRGWGWFTNTKKAAYNRVYNRTTFGCGTLILIGLFVLIAGLAFARGGGGGHSSSSGTVHVNGYYKSNGTYVQPHTRTAPDGIKNNNLSYHDGSDRQSSKPTEHISDTDHVDKAPSEHQVNNAIKPEPKSVIQEPTKHIESITTPPDNKTIKSDSNTLKTTTKRSYSSTIKHQRYIRSTNAKRDSHGHIKRSAAAKKQFLKQTGYPKGRRGYVVDHIIPLKRGGRDDPSNMQWQTVQDAKAKDKVE